jgi:hypothetical protein
MGDKEIITYTLASEGGALLRAVGAMPTGPLESQPVGQPEPAPHEPRRLQGAEMPLGVVSRSRSVGSSTSANTIH